MDRSDQVLGEEGSFSDCNPLIMIAPPGLDLSTELSSDTEVLCLDNKLAISNWVKHRLPGFSKLVGLSLSRYEKLCTVLLQRLERETETANLLHRKATAH